MKIINSKSASAHFMSKYNEGKREEGTAQLLLSNVAAASGEDLEAVMNHFAYQAKTRNLKNRFCHLKISLSPKDSAISNHKFEQLGLRVLDELGYNNNAFAIYRHLDTDHPHLHVVLSRVDFNGKLVSDSYDGLKAKRIERELVDEFELTPSHDKLITKGGVRLPGYTERWQMKEENALRKDLTKKGLVGMELEVKVAEHRKQAVNSLKKYVQNTVLECLYDHPSGEIFLKRLARRGVTMVRHEFENNGKTNYGISYCYDPDKAKITFESKDLPGQIAGDVLFDVALESKYYKHAYFNEIPVRPSISAKGMPQLCLFDAKPVEPESKVSFRAMSLGPAFMEKSLKRVIDFTEDSLKLITLRRKKKKNVLYPDNTKKILNEENQAISKLLVAAELRSASRVKEVLQDQRGGIPKINGLGTENDIDFISSIAAAIKTNDIGQEKIADKPKEKRDFVNPLILKYQEELGIEPSPSTRIALGYMHNQNWQALADLLHKQMEAAITKDEWTDLIDEKILNFVPLGREARTQAYNFAKWREENSNEYTFIVDQQKEKIARDTEQLMLALREDDTYAIKEIITKLEPDFKLIPETLLLGVSDRELSLEILRLAGMISDDVNKGDINEVREKGVDSREQGQSNSEQDLNNEEGFNTGKPI